MANFMPKGQSVVKLGPDWSVIGITAIDGDSKVPFKVMGGELEKLPTRHIIPKKRFDQLNNQVRAVVADAEKRAKLAQELKKPNWAFDLEKYGVLIEPDGCLKISRWFIDQSGRRRRLWQTVKDINSAIRMQDHIIQQYLAQKSPLKNDTEIPPEFSTLLKRLSVILPFIEMRRELLLFARGQMDTSIRRTNKGLTKLLAVRGRDSEKCHGLPEKLKRLAFFLSNSWPNPYREKIDQLMPLIKAAKKSAASWQWNRAEFLLTRAKEILAAAGETYERAGSIVRISEIDPIKILSEIDKYGLADEVLALAKKHLSEPYYYAKLGLFRLSAMLAISQLVITGQDVSQEKISKLLN